ncbi:hypothetical protein CR513_10466, partial [Mucuna pruriens]
MLASPPILVKPIEGNPILICLSVFNNTISAAIVQEVKKDRCSTYFISKTLQGAETRYQNIEKAALVLIVMARRLRSFEKRRHIKAEVLVDFINKLTST